MQHTVPPGGFSTDFYRLWAATALSNLSDGIRLATLPLLAYTLTRDPGLVAGVYVATQVPWLLFGLVAGAIVDRRDRRRVVVVAHLTRALTVAVLAAAVAGGWASVPLLYAAAFVLGIAETLFDNGVQALVPELVARRHLERANSRLEIAMLVGQRFVGPPVGAALFTAAAVVAFAADAALLVLAALVVFAIRGPRTVERPVREPTALRRDIAEGIRWLLGHRILRTVSIVGAVVNFMMSAVIAVYVLFAFEVLGFGEFGYSMMLVALALGGVLGSLLAPRLTPRLGRRGGIVLAVGVAGAAQLLTGLIQHPVVIGLLQVVLAAGASVWAVITTSLRQAVTPNALLGRVIGAHRLLSWGGGAVGAAAGGLIATILGLRAPFVLGGIALLVVLVPMSRLLRGADELMDAAQAEGAP
jgi:MFS family permease